MRNRTRYGLRGQRIGEAANPGPSNRRRRTQRRALPWSWDSDSESADERNVASRMETVESDVVEQVSGRDISPQRPEQMVASSGSVRRVHQTNLVESPVVRVEIPTVAGRSQAVVDVPTVGVVSQVEEMSTAVVFPMTDDAVECRRDVIAGEGWLQDGTPRSVQDRVSSESEGRAFQICQWSRRRKFHGVCPFQRSRSRSSIERHSVGQ